jgi:alanyl-tRNA synthetase
MQDQRALDAISRIQRAIERLEAVTSSGAAQRRAEEHERLRAAHALLRSRVEAAIGEIDLMITPGEGAAG